MGIVEQDARSRARRTFLQGLAVDVAAALIVLMLPLVTGAETWGDLDWAVVGFLAAKTVVVTALSYVMRAYIDPYRALKRGERGAGEAMSLAVIAFCVAAVLWFFGVIPPGR